MNKTRSKSRVRCLQRLETPTAFRGAEFPLLERGKLRIRCAGIAISADSTPRPAARTPAANGRAGQKTWRGRHGQHCQQRNPQHCEVPTEHSFPGELPDLRRLAPVLEALPDEALPARLAERLAERRGRYPVRAADDHRRASARAVAGSGAQPQRALCGFSPPDCQGKPKVDDDGKPDVY